MINKYRDRRGKLWGWCAFSDTLIFHCKARKLVLFIVFELLVACGVIQLAHR